MAGLLAAALLMGPNAVLAGNGNGNGNGNGHDYKGSATLFLISAAPNLERCGDAVELVFEGSGIDTAGGIVTIESSACQDFATGEVFDLVALDTYANGDSVNIVSDTFYFTFDPATCVSTNTHPVHFIVDGGTGAYAGASGGGKYDIALSDPNCSGQVTPAFVWFRGKFFE